MGRGSRTRPNDVGMMLGFGDDGQERILETSLVQKGHFIKAQGHDRKELCWHYEEWLIISHLSS